MILDLIFFSFAPFSFSSDEFLFMCRFHEAADTNEAEAILYATAILYWLCGFSFCI